LDDLSFRRCKSENDVKIFNIETVEKYALDSVNIKDFEFIKMLGKGAYGGVYLARKK